MVLDKFLWPTPDALIDTHFGICILMSFLCDSRTPVKIISEKRTSWGWEPSISMEGRGLNGRQFTTMEAALTWSRKVFGKPITWQPGQPDIHMKLRRWCRAIIQKTNKQTNNWKQSWKIEGKERSNEVKNWSGVQGSVQGPVILWDAHFLGSGQCLLKLIPLKWIKNRCQDWQSSWAVVAKCYISKRNTAHIWDGPWVGFRESQMFLRRNFKKKHQFMQKYGGKSWRKYLYSGMRSSFVEY